MRPWRLRAHEKKKKKKKKKLVAGASPAEVAHVLGGSVTEMTGRWRTWAEGQRSLRDWCPGLGLGRDEYEKVAAVLAGAAGNDPGQFTGMLMPGRRRASRFTPSLTVATNPGEVNLLACHESSAPMPARFVDR